MAIPWSKAKGTLDRADATERAILERRPDFAHHLDQLRAAIRDGLDDVGLSIVDENVIYTALVVATLFADVATWLERLDLVEADKVADLGTVVGALSIVLAPYAPVEARS